MFVDKNNQNSSISNIKNFLINKDYKRVDVNKNLWVCDYGNGTFEIFIRACGPTGAYVYRYEKERLKWCQRRSYGGASTPKYFNFFKSDW